MKRLRPVTLEEALDVLRDSLSTGGPLTRQDCDRVVYRGETGDLFLIRELPRAMKDGETLMIRGRVRDGGKKPHRLETWR